jgi:hypothetical protein
VETLVAPFNGEESVGDAGAIGIISDSDRLQTWPLLVPAKRYVPLTTKVFTKEFSRPELTSVQRVPQSVVRKTLLIAVPAKGFVPLTAKAYAVPVKPVSIDVQFVPLLVERKTPLVVPAKRFVPITARQATPFWR